MEALSFWLISIVQDEGRLTGPNYQTHHPVLRVKKSRISRGIITVRRPCDQEFYSIGCCDIEELISFRLTHQILQIPAETLSFWRLNCFNPDEARLLEVCSWCWFSAMKRYKVSYCQLYYIYSYLHFYIPPPYFIHTPIFVKFLLYNSTIKKFKYC